MIQIINFWAILVASVVALIIGGLWYSPVLFGKQWLQYRKVSMQASGGFELSKLFLEFISAFVSAFVLALLTFALPATVYAAVIFGLIIWVGFYVPVLLGEVVWEDKPFGLFLIHVGLRFVVVLTMTLIVVLWR